jgi:hypothetical protein
MIAFSSSSSFAGLALIDKSLV